MSWWTFTNNVLPCLMIPGILIVLVIIGIIVDRSSPNTPNSTTNVEEDPPTVRRTHSNFNQTRWDHVYTIKQERSFDSDAKIRSRYERDWGSVETDKAFEDADRPGFVRWLFGG